MAVPPPRDPWYGRYRAYGSRPYPGCGCLYILAVVLLLWILFAWIFAWPYPWSWWYV